MWTGLVNRFCYMSSMHRLLKNRTVIVNTQGSKLTVASSKFATLKSYLPPERKVGSTKLLHGNYLVTVNFLEALANFH